MNHYNSAKQLTRILKSPINKIKHSRDDSSLDKNHKSLLKNNQSNRRITTEQSDKIIKKNLSNDHAIISLKKKKNQQNNTKLLLKQSININMNMNVNSNVISNSTNPKNHLQSQQISMNRSTKHNSSKNIKNIKLLTSIDKIQIQKFNDFLSPKHKPILNHVKEKQIYSKSTLKKIGGKINNNSNKVNKTTQQEKISHFNFNQIQQKYKQLSKMSKKGFKDLNNISIKHQKSTIKNTQNNTKSSKNENSKNIDSSKRQKNIINKIQKSKIYHKLKMKTQHSMLSCQSTPSQIMSHDIQILQMIGEGTFGKVYKAILKKSSELIAIKKVYQDKRYKNREVQIISMLNSNFIMKVLGTYITCQQNDKQYLNIIMKYYQLDLYKQINQKDRLSILEIKIYTYQIFRGLLYLHSKDICHRDIKPHNILIDKMSVAICDFGSAKILIPHQKNLPYICSRCYRAPQLIFGSTQYTTMIDIWSVGCVILQMMHGAPFFIGNSSIDHLIKVIKALGTPTKTQVKQMNPQYDLKDYKFPNIKNKSFYQIFPHVDPLLINLLQQIMIYAPKERLNAAQALVHEFYDQIRDKQTYQTLKKQYNLPDFFDFTPQQMKGNEHLYWQLVPQWYSQNHQTYFQQEQIEKNNSLKFYYD